MTPITVTMPTSYLVHSLPGSPAGSMKAPFELHHLVIHAPHRQSTDDEKRRVKISLDKP